MSQKLLLATLASFVLLSQAVPKSEVLDETWADIVELPSLKREEGHRKYTFEAFGNTIDLDLEKTNTLLPAQLPVYVYGEDKDGNPSIQDWTHRTDDSFQTLYTDRRRGASVMVEDKEGQIKISGLLGGGLVIEPVKVIDLPEVRNNNFSEVPEVSRLRHLVYKVNEDTLPLVKDDEKDVEYTKRAILPEILYVPIQVVVDYGLWKKMDTTEDEVIKYIKQFYNSVDQLYAKLSWPRVSISIYGITICKTASACNMIESVKIDSKSIDSSRVLGNIARYAYDQKSNTGTDYALMMVMTAYDMCAPQPDGGCNQAVVRTTPLGTVCGRFRNGQTSKIGIAEDHGVFHGVNIVTDAIGNLLGMLPDGESLDSTTDPDMIGTPGASDCPYSDGYIMGEIDPTNPKSNNFEWSQCSINQLRWFSKQKQATCLHVVPTPGHPLIPKPPGSDIGLDNQCKVLFGPTSKVGCRMPGVNSGNDQLCQLLACKVSDTTCQSKGPAADGSYCGPQRHCLQGKCVCDPNAPLPTAPPRDPSCKGDHSWLQINGKPCAEHLSAADADGLQACHNELVKENCCESVSKYCKADPISCDHERVVTQRPVTPPDHVFTLAPTTTRRPYVPPSDINCGKPCSDNNNVRIDEKDCKGLLSTDEDKWRLCDHALVLQHCCRTRTNVCAGFYSLTPSCDDSCKDHPTMTINNKKCVQLLQSPEDRENLCEHDVTKKYCCATRWKVCPPSSPFGR